VRLSFLALFYAWYVPVRAVESITLQLQKRQKRQPHSKTLARLTGRPFFLSSAEMLQGATGC